MSLKKIILFVVLCLIAIISIYTFYEQDEILAYRNSVNKPPSGYNGPVFELQHDYPKSLPITTIEEFPWLSTPVRFDRPVGGEGEWTPAWSTYAKQVKTYLKENIALTNTGYTLNKPWYNLPWLAAGPYTGREYTHGARYSFSIPLQQIDSNAAATEFVPVWGIANYNKVGGYTIGKMWSKEGTLNYESGINEKMLKGLPFADGTVIHKINMIGHLGNHKASHLNGAPTWNLNLHTVNPNGHTFKGPPERSIQKAHVFEMDFMVKDSRSPTGWVFGAFVYDETVAATKTMWDRYKVMGLQFGNDPETFPAVAAKVSKPVYQTLLKPISENWTVGCNGRLATFQGTPNQNCVGCHQTASVATGMSKIASRGFSLTYGISCSPVDTKLYDFYFQNFKYPEKFTGKPNAPINTIAGLDFSLRLYDVISAYEKYKD